MEDEIRDVIFIALELMIASVVIGVIILMGNQSRGLIENKRNIEHNAKYMQALDELFYFNNREVSCSDIIELILTETRNYDYYFYSLDDAGNWMPLKDTDGNKLEFSFDDEQKYYTTGVKKDAFTYWSEDTIRTKLKSYEKTRFVAHIKLGPSNATDDKVAVNFVYTGG